MGRLPILFLLCGGFDGVQKVTHVFLISLLVIAGIIFSLVAISWGLATARALFGKKQPAFNYPADVPIAEAQAASEGYLHKALVAIDICLNVVVLGGRQSETISTHAWIAAQEKKLWGRIMNAWLNGFQRDHGAEAASGDLQRASAEVSRMVRLLGVK
jgi:hypothetical protein